MKACAANRELIVGQIFETLDARQTRQLRAHLEICEDCRRYQAEISHVTGCLATVKINPDLQASERFHRKVTQKLRTAKPSSLRAILAAYVRDRQLPWRVAVPLVAALVFIGILLATWPQPRKITAHRSTSPSVLLAAGSDNHLAPTLANYQRAANQSWEKLDALLTRQSERALPALPSYTASTPNLANESF